MMKNVIKSYENYREEDRLTTNNARKVEFETTIRIFNELFPTNAKILDCAAGTGVYAFALAEKGFDVTATDITPRHIDYINEELKSKSYSMNTAVLDASDLSMFADESFDIVLNMGPFYHITEAKDRDRCMQENLRVLKKGGLLFTAYISRFHAFAYVALSDARFLNEELAKQLITTGILNQEDVNCFWTDTFYAAPAEIEQYYIKNGLKIVDHFAQDGIAPLQKKIIDNFNEEQFIVWCNYHYSICREASILGASSHTMIVGRK